MLRACWVTQAELGFAVTPPKWTRRVPASMKNKTYRVLSHTVSTVKKSQAKTPWALVAEELRPGRPDARDPPRESRGSDHPRERHASRRVKDGLRPESANSLHVQHREGVAEGWCIS